MSEVDGEIALTDYGATLLFKIMEMTGETMEGALILALEESIARIESEPADDGPEAVQYRPS